MPLYVERHTAADSESEAFWVDMPEALLCAASLRIPEDDTRFPRGTTCVHHKRSNAGDAQCLQTTAAAASSGPESCSKTRSRSSGSDNAGCRLAMLKKGKIPKH